MNSKTLRKIVQKIFDEVPPRTEDEEKHLARPINDEAGTLIALAASMDSLPLEGIDDLKPILSYTIEDLALNCQVIGDKGKETRERVNAWLDQVKVAVS